MEAQLLLGSAVKRERKARKLTQTQLAELSGTGLNFISQLERGKPGVRMDKVLEVLGVLGLQLLLVRGREVLAVSEGLKH